MKRLIEFLVALRFDHTLWYSRPASFMLAVISPLTYAVDVLPGNGVPPPMGYQAIQSSYQVNESYISTSDTTIKNNVLTLKYTKAIQPLGIPSAFFVQPSYVISTLSNKSITRVAEGVGDTVIAFATWPYVEKRRFLGLAGYIFSPTGEYDSNRSINPGSNRWSYAFQSGYQFPLYEQIDMMIAADIQLFSNNNESPIKKKTLVQDEIYNYQATVMSPVTETIKVAESYFMQRGGAVEVDGVPISEALKRERFEITSIYISQFGSFYLQYGSDIFNDNSSEALERYRLSFRYQKKF